MQQCINEKQGVYKLPIPIDTHRYPEIMRFPNGVMTVLNTDAYQYLITESVSISPVMTVMKHAGPDGERRGCTLPVRCQPV